MKTLFALLTLCLIVAAGCRLAEHLPGNLYVAKDRTTYRTPDMRLDAIREIANRADGTDTPQQQAFVTQLASQIQVDPDPLIRRQIVLTVSEFKVPLAQQILVAGLGDSESMVRLVCCEKLGERADASAIAPLAKTVADDSSVDVRLAATAALGKYRSPEAARALTAALSDNDPAMQYAGVQAMKSVTGKDYGPNVEAWLQVAQGETPTIQTPAGESPEVSVATKPSRWLPFR